MRRKTIGLTISCSDSTRIIAAFDPLFLPQYRWKASGEPLQVPAKPAPIMSAFFAIFYFVKAKLSKLI